MKRRILTGILVAAGLWAQQPPDRVGRVGFVHGVVQYRPDQTQDWGDATVNLPLSAGDHLWTDLNAQAEVRAGSAAVHIAPQTGFSILALDDNSARLSITEGAANVRIARLNDGETVEFTTPIGSFRLLRPGTYRIDAVPGGNYVSLTVRSGAAEATGGPQTVTVAPGQRVVLAGNPPTVEFLDAPPPDAWDEWCASRDEIAERGFEEAEPYVSWEIPGSEDLAGNGDWTVDAEFGACWTPSAVSADWTPFRFGHWIYKAPWGWTWIDDAPWAFAPSHYGRWARIKHGWSWIPGHRHRKEPYSPATVAFAPGGAGRVTWVPIAPGESVGSGVRRNREGATSAAAEIFRFSRPIGPARHPGAGGDFTSRAPSVDPTPEAYVGGRIHPSKADVQARGFPPPPAATPPAEPGRTAIPRPEPERRVAVEDHRAAEVRHDDPPPPTVHVEEPRRVEETRRSEEPRHSEEPRRSEEPQHAPEPRHESRSSPPPQASAPPPSAQSAPSHAAAQEHRAETPRASESSRSSGTTGGSRK